MADSAKTEPTLAQAGFDSFAKNKKGRQGAGPFA
jgi:hypothetical protein